MVICTRPTVNLFQYTTLVVSERSNIASCTVLLKSIALHRHKKAPPARARLVRAGIAMSLFNVCACLLLQGFEVTIQLTDTLEMLCLTLLLVVERILRLRMLEGELMRHLTCMIQDRVFVHSENKV